MDGQTDRQIERMHYQLVACMIGPKVGNEHLITPQTRKINSYLVHPIKNA